MCACLQNKRIIQAIAAYLDILGSFGMCIVSLRCRHKSVHAQLSCKSTLKRTSLALGIILSRRGATASALFIRSWPHASIRSIQDHESSQGWTIVETCLNHQLGLKGFLKQGYPCSSIEPWDFPLSTIQLWGYHGAQNMWRVSPIFGQTHVIWLRIFPRNSHWYPHDAWCLTPDL